MYNDWNYLPWFRHCASCDLPNKCASRFDNHNTSPTFNNIHDNSRERNRSSLCWKLCLYVHVHQQRKHRAYMARSIDCQGLLLRHFAPRRSDFRIALECCKHGLWPLLPDFDDKWRLAEYKRYDAGPLLLRGSNLQLFARWMRCTIRLKKQHQNLQAWFVFCWLSNFSRFCSGRSWLYIALADGQTKPCRYNADRCLWNRHYGQCFWVFKCWRSYHHLWYYSTIHRRFEIVHAETPIRPDLTCADDKIHDQLPVRHNLPPNRNGYVLRKFHIRGSCMRDSRNNIQPHPLESRHGDGTGHICVSRRDP